MSTRNFSALALTVFAGVALAAPARAQDKQGDIATAKVDLAPCKPMASTAKTAFSFDKVPLQAVLDQVARIRCMNFILSDQVKGKGEITIMAKSTVTVSQAYAAFLSVLEANGMGDLSHAWAATPLYQMSSRILGVEPAAPGFTKILLKPRLGDLQWAKGTVPTPHGPVTVSWAREGTHLRFEVDLPEGTETTLALPRNGRKASLELDGAKGQRE